MINSVVEEHVDWLLYTSMITVKNESINVIG